MKNVCVYCGSSDSVPANFFTAARSLGVSLAKNGLRVIYGGGKTGLMGAVAQSALEAGGEVIGIIIHAMNTPALAQQGLTRLEVTDTMHNRKARMYELSDAFIALPGGIGTFDELFETLTWGQIGLHSKPVGLMNVDGYYDPLLEMLDRATQNGFIFEEHRSALASSPQPEALLAALRAYEHPAEAVKRWMRQE
jgi:uncharacterized protein (TIGR00730 family)